jgi:membrane protease YdiL (CAAX protease family)
VQPAPPAATAEQTVAAPAGQEPPDSPEPPEWLPRGVAGGPATEVRLKVELLVMLFLTAVPGLVLGLRGFTDPQSVDTDVPVLDLVAALFIALGPAAVATYMLWRDGRLGAAGFGRRSLKWIAGYGALGAVCAVIALLSAAVLLSMVLAIVGVEPPQRDVDDVALSVGSVVAGILISLVAGVGEEIVYRAYAISRLEELGWMRAAVWAPWAVFTVQHVYQGPAAILIIGGVAATFVWLYRWQRSVWPVMVAHAAYDMFVFFVLILAA